MDAKQAIPVRIGSQSRVFGVSPKGRTMLLDEVSKVRSAKITAIVYFPSGIRAYHSHKLGRSWIPTAPKEAAGSSSMEVQDVTLESFLSNLPIINLENSSKKRWFPDKVQVSSYTVEGANIAIWLNQMPWTEGISAFRIDGRVTRPLSFLDGKGVLEVTLADFFDLGRRLRVYHDGHSGARIGIQHSARFNPVVCISTDGVRERFLYRPNKNGHQMATLYLRSPSALYSFVRADHDVGDVATGGLNPDFTLRVNPVRNLERNMLRHGNAYDHGTLGAEIAYAVASRMLMSDQLVMLEPAMRGSGIVSRDRTVAVEARLLTSLRIGTPSFLKHDAIPHMKQMLGRLRWGLSKGAFKRGIAIMCLRITDRQILALVKEA